MRPPRPALLLAALAIVAFLAASAAYFGHVHDEAAAGGGAHASCQLCLNFERTAGALGVRLEAARSVLVARHGHPGAPPQISCEGPTRTQLPRAPPLTGHPLS